MKPEAKWTTTCEHCGGALEFAASDAGKQADCCYCGKATILNHNPPAQECEPSKTNLLKTKRSDSISSKFLELLPGLATLILALFFAWATIHELKSLMQQFDASPSASWSTTTIILCILSAVLSLVFLGLSLACKNIITVVFICMLPLASICWVLFTILHYLGFMCFVIVTGVGGIACIISSVSKKGGEIVYAIFSLGFAVLMLAGFFANRSTSQVSPSWWDGSVSPVKHWLKANANDPSSLQYVHWNSSKLGNGDVDVVVQYRAKNGFGALTLHRGDFILSPDGTILRANPDMDNP